MSILSDNLLLESGEGANTLFKQNLQQLFTLVFGPHLLLIQFLLLPCTLVLCRFLFLAGLELHLSFKLFC